MHVSFRRSNFALGALALGLALLASSCELNNRRHEAEPYHAGQEQADRPVDPALPPSRTSLREQACADAEQSWSGDPDYRDKSDLCAQYLNAVAADRTAGWAEAQAWIGGAGLLAVLATLVFNGLATREAANSAAAAAKSNEDAREFFTQERRPWLSADVRVVSGRPAAADTQDLALDIVVRNVGLTPAIFVEVVLPFEQPPEDWGAARMKELREAVAKAKEGRRPGVSLFPQQEPLRETAFIPFPDAVPSGEELMRFLGGYVRYERTDAPGVIHTTPFLWMVVIWFDTTGRREDVDFKPFLINIGPD